MGIVDEDIAAVRQAADIVAIVSQYTQGKQVGRSWVALCPFHGEKSGSFNVNPQSNVFHCFGCGKSGDVITFVREIEHLDFVGAVEWLAARSGMTLRYTSNDEGASRKQRQQLFDVMAAAVEWYHQRLLTGADAGPARSYLRGRGFDGETVRRYGLGWAPAAWDELVKGLDAPGDLLVQAGLAFTNRSGRATDAFRGRVLFPIHDVEGRPVALGGRVLPGDDGPKYKNSPETALYSKSRVLYGLNWHKGDIVKEGTAGEVIVCEGYTDVIGFARAGVPRAVATCGTALTEDHVKLLARFARRIVLAFDADAAGQGAAERFSGWEDRYQLEVCVADLPAGRDPGDLAQSDPARLVQAVAPLAEWRVGETGAKPFLAFRLDRVLAAADLRSVEGRARAAAAGVDVVREHPNELVRDAYLMKLADFCQLDADRLRAQLRAPAAASVGGGGGRGRSGGGAPGPTSVPGSTRIPRLRDRPPGDGGDDGWAPGSGGGGGGGGVPDHRREPPPVETLALVLVVHRRDEILPYLADPLFTDDRNLVSFWALLSEPDVASALDLLRATDPGAAEVLSAAVVTDTDAAPLDVAARLIEAAANRRLRVLQAEARTAVDPLSHVEEMRALKLGVEALREDDTRAEAAADLVARIVEADAAATAEDAS